MRKHCSAAVGGERSLQDCSQASGTIDEDSMTMERRNKFEYDKGPL